MSDSADNTPLQTVGGSYSRDVTLVRKFDVVFIIGGPEADGDSEPYDVMDSFTPPSTPLNLPETERKGSKNEKGEWLLTITYEGIPDTDPIPDPGDVLKTGRGAEIELDHVGVEDPLESYPKIIDLVNKYSGLPAGLVGGKLQGWQPQIKDPSTGQMETNPLLGATHYLNDGVVLRLTFATPKFDASYLQNICKIDPALIPPDLLSAIAADATGLYSYLKRAVKGQWRGNVWRLTFEWELGKWIPDIYLPDVGTS